MRCALTFYLLSYFIANTRHFKKRVEFLWVSGGSALLILQPFHHFTYVTTHSPTLLSLYLRHSLFSNPSVASPTSQFILQPCFHFSYVSSSSLNSPGEPPMYTVWFLRDKLYLALISIFLGNKAVNWIAKSKKDNAPCTTTAGNCFRCLNCKFYLKYSVLIISGSVAQEIRSSPSTAGVPSSRLGHSMWVLWWTRLSLGTFFSAFLPVSIATNLIPPFTHTHLIHFISVWWCVRVGLKASLLFTDLQERALSHLISRSGSVSDMSWGIFIKQL